MKQNVVLINYTGRKGGGPLDAYEMAKALKNAGVSVAAILSDQIENKEFWLRLNLDKLVFIPTYHNAVEAVLNTLLFPFKQRQIIISEFKDYNVYSIYCPMGALWASKVNACFKKSQKAIVIHDPIQHSGEKFKRIFDNDGSKDYDMMIVHSKKFVNYVEEKYHRPTYYVPLGRHDFYRTCENKKSIIAYNPQTINLLFFGRISKYKGLDILAESYKQLSEKYKNRITLSIVGAGDFAPYEEKFKKLDNVVVRNQWIKDEEIESIFTGDNLICVCPYLDATQSGVVMVAMDYGIPLVVTDAGALDEQVEQGKTALIVKAGDSEELSKAIEKLIDDIELRQEMSNNQLEEIKEHTWGNSAEKLIEIMKLAKNK